MSQTEAELLAYEEDMPSGGGDGTHCSDHNAGDNVNNNISNNINNTINNNEHKLNENLTNVKAEIKLELEALDINKEKSTNSSRDNIPLNQLVGTVTPVPVVNVDGNDDSTIPAEKMNLDDPEVFGPFTKSQITATISNSVDQMFYDSFQDQISLLQSAIGKKYLYF